MHASDQFKHINIQSIKKEIILLYDLIIITFAFIYGINWILLLFLWSFINDVPLYHQIYVVATYIHNLLLPDVLLFPSSQNLLLF